MKQTLRILLMMLLALALATSAFAQDTVSVGDVIEGEADDDTVEYEIELEEDQTVEISLESEDFDTYLYILDEDGDEVDSNAPKVTKTKSTLKNQIVIKTDHSKPFDKKTQRKLGFLS